MNSAPVCTDLALSSVSGGSALAAITCTDYDGDALTYSVKTQPAHGSVVQSGSTVTYVSSTGYVGTDTFTLAASDGTTSTQIAATVSVTTPPAATVSGAVTATSSSVSLGLACASGTAACSGTASLSATLSGRSYSLGSAAVHDAIPR